MEVKLKEYGVDSIEVSDNGTGIDASNYRSIALRSHTSKLNHFEDLTSVNSFGFRGEALNALSELSGGNLVITTKKSADSVGQRLTFERDGQ